MFIVTESDADAIRAALFDEGELSAVIELRRRFPGITDNGHTSACVRNIAGWKPAPVAQDKAPPEPFTHVMQGGKRS